MSKDSHEVTESVTMRLCEWRSWTVNFLPTKSNKGLKILDEMIYNE